MKCYCFCRVSTDRQEVESQIKETVEYAKTLGYDDIEVISGVGASAIKINSLYVQKINELLQKVKSGDVVVVWHLNRLARNDEWAIKIKNHFIENNVQLYVKEPHIKLLNDDGTVDNGAELCFSLFATMSKQQMAELHAKMSRAKKRNKEQGKFNGGRILYGYDTDSEGHIIIDESKSELILLIYTLYSSGQYTYSSLAYELQQRGYEIDTEFVAKHLTMKQYYDGSYPQIITKELYGKCESVRVKNFKYAKRQHKHYFFGSRLIRCECGAGYTATKRCYVCYKAKNGGQHSRQYSIRWMDGLLWTMASYFETQFVLNTTATEKAKLDSEIALRERKITEADNRKAKVEIKRQRALNGFLDALLTEEQYQSRADKLKNELKDIETDIAKWKAEIEELTVMKDSAVDDDRKRILGTVGLVYGSDEEQMLFIVRKWVKRITSRDNFVCIETLNGIYLCSFNGHSKYPFKTVNGNVIDVQPLDRTVEGVVIKGNGIPVSNNNTNFNKWIEGKFI